MTELQAMNLLTEDCDLSREFNSKLSCMLCSLILLVLSSDLVSDNLSVFACSTNL